MCLLTLTWYMCFSSARATPNERKRVRRLVSTFYYSLFRRSSPPLPAQRGGGWYYYYYYEEKTDQQAKGGGAGWKPREREIDVRRTGNITLEEGLLQAPLRMEEDITSSSSEGVRRRLAQSIFISHTYSPKRWDSSSIVRIRLPTALDGILIEMSSKFYWYWMIRINECFV